MRLLHQETALWVSPGQSGYQFDLNQTLEHITYGHRPQYTVANSQNAL